MATKIEALQLIFARPFEPIFMPKGQGTPYVFDVPDSFLCDRFRKLKDRIEKRFDAGSATKIPVRNITIPDISTLQQLGMKDDFSLFVPFHEELAAKLVEIFMNQNNVDDLISVAAYCHERINPYLFNYALSVAVLHRKDTRSIGVPNLFECFPGKFIDSGVISQAKQESVMIPSADREVIVIPREYTANSREPEQRFAFFREDIGLNIHHWHWHLVYPARSATLEVVKKDRRGELFYYMHQQIVARYNTERFAYQTPRATSLANFRDPIPEGYFPKLSRNVASRAWAPRFTNYKVSDVNRPNNRFIVSIQEMETWEKNILNVIKTKVAVDESGKNIQLDEKKGIDILGNIIEASVLTPNRKLYGNFHNMGHVIMGLCHDPDGRFLETFGTIGDEGTSVRDPVFYRWHTKMNDLFYLYKDSLPKYTVQQLEFKNISVIDVQILTDGKTANQCNTFWQQTDIDLSRGIDFVPRGSVRVRFTHLQHEPFSYKIQIKNSSSSNKIGTVRIFIAPKVDDKGASMNFDVQRKIMIELDKFKVTLNSGDNTIKRLSTESSLTLPFEKTFRNLDANRPSGGQKLDAFNFCSCGWPQHLLVPKGTEKGMDFDLFVMVSNYDDDKVEQDLTGSCLDADTFCGVYNKLYPDKRSMGYPFDRMGRDGVKKLADFLTSNMKVKSVTVKFTEKTVIKNYTSSNNTNNANSNNSNNNNNNSNNNNNNNSNNNANNNNSGNNNNNNNNSSNNNNWNNNNNSNNNSNNNNSGNSNNNNNNWSNSNNNNNWNNNNNPNKSNNNSNNWNNNNGNNWNNNNNNNWNNNNNGNNWNNNNGGNNWNNNNNNNNWNNNNNGNNGNNNNNGNNWDNNNNGNNWNNNNNNNDNWNNNNNGNNWNNNNNDNWNGGNNNNEPSVVSPNDNFSSKNNKHRDKSPKKDKKKKHKHSDKSGSDESDNDYSVVASSH